MSVRSPPPTARSFSSPTVNGRMSAAQARYTPSVISGRSGNNTKSGLAPANLNPDDLFTKHTVSEVRGVQQRLRADAEAKQEELRLMVGERYRDLLQASSSIISIAKSSQQVYDALEEIRVAIQTQDGLPLPPRTAAIEGSRDSHLVTLQTLSAHMKLLLDAPEYLWRLIERKKYMHASWLFLLSRVAHQGLVSQDEMDMDDQSWSSEGIDVLAEFPLVQRQWDVISPFRAQIIHKATLSLREITMSTEEICGTLVTLHLLDSQPLHETLSALLQQRSRTLQSVLSWQPDPGTPKSDHASSSNLANGHAADPIQSLSMREIIQVMKKALGAVSQTISSARTIFQGEGSEPSLIVQLLSSMQEDTSRMVSEGKPLPKGLTISTQSLLSQLTSSANVQLLPHTLRSYKPYIDLGSYSTSLSRSDFTRRLREWFDASSTSIERSATHWFSSLRSVKEVWTLRNSVRRHIATSGLDKEEKRHLTSSLDKLCQGRILAVWQETLSDTQVTFKKALHENVHAAQQKDLAKDNSSPMDFLFQPPSIPILSQTVKSFVDTPFQKYQQSLKRQLVGRSNQIDVVLSTLEQCARTLQQDFLQLRTNADETTKPFVEDLINTYQPAATTLSENVINILQETTDNAITESECLHIVLMSRLVDNLASSSYFIEKVGCSKNASEDFNVKLNTMGKLLIAKWQDLVVTQVVTAAKKSVIRSQQTQEGPSVQMFQALSSLSQHIRELGIVYHPIGQHSIVRNLLRSFITAWSDEIWAEDFSGSLPDITFLRYTSDRYGESWSDISSKLLAKEKQAASDQSKLADSESSASDYLARAQTLFAVLLPEPLEPAFHAPLLRFGTPAGSQTHHAAIQLAKPTPRFGMLLVGNVEA
ncbi:hypothetical protein D9619_002857 [Psilocybe cf. subviscida]|uniref:Conserved oligomeric Golgi complex subunit 1 n=1 Tax=Psilocybe cf. subviscida TaxID=2480587 RepID=A0A8H5EUE8_9AGAR|nr:hypothetical protein D9619_002857 [Psilocybe cf. subviscida]